MKVTLIPSPSLFPDPPPIDELGRKLLDITRIVPVGQEKKPAASARALWELAGKPDSVFTRWTKNGIKREQLVEGKDFVLRDRVGHAKNGRGGSNAQDWLFTPNAAKRVLAGDHSDLGRQIRAALIDLEERIERGDPEVMDYLMSRMDVEDLPKVANMAHDRAWRYWSKQGRSSEWFSHWWDVRTRGTVYRILFCAGLQRHGVSGRGFPDCTNAISLGLSGKTVRQQREAKGLAKSRTPRDVMELSELVDTMFAEDVSTQVLDDRDSQGNDACRHVCFQVASEVAQLRKRFAQPVAGKV
jgi:phage anti-repressor protein